MRAVIACAVAAVAISLLPAPAAQGTITIGSDLSGPVDTGFGCGGPTRCTMAQTSPDGKYVSPVNGVINLWRAKVSTPGGDFLNLRVIRPGAAAGNFTGAGISSAGMTTDTGLGSAIFVFPAQVPIRVGERIGVDAFQDVLAMSFGGFPGTISRFSPTIIDGTERTPDSFYTAELLLNADIVPDNQLTVGRVTSNRKGIVTLEVTAPNAGTLRAGDVNDPAVATAAAPRPFLNAVTMQVASAGPLNLTLLPTKAAKKRLRKKGKASATVKLTFTPMAGTAGTVTAPVKLRKKRKKKKKK